MNLLHDRRIPLILILLLFVIPLNIYVIGEWIGTGIQWALFRYQDTLYGSNLITLTMDFEYITKGILTGKTVFSIAFWIAGTILFIIAFIALGVMVLEGMNEKKHLSGLLVIASGILYLASCMIQYGPFFRGPAGISIPVGIPLILAIGWLIYSKTIGGDEKKHVPEDMTVGEDQEE